MSKDKTQKQPESNGGSVGLKLLLDGVPSCECQSCRSACSNKPGWFLPEEIEAVKKHFGTDNIRDLLGENKLAIDWWVGDEDDILVLAPNIKHNDDIQYPRNPQGECVFLKDGKCSIYAIRPAECRGFHHDDKKTQHDGLHEKVAKEWEKVDMLEDFEIETGGFGMLDMFGMGW